MEDAALIVNRNKAAAKGGDYVPSDGEAERPAVREVTITPGLDEFAKGQQVDRKDFATGIQRVKDMHRVGVNGKSFMELPGL